MKQYILRIQANLPTSYCIPQTQLNYKVLSKNNCSFWFPFRFIFSTVNLNLYLFSFMFPFHLSLFPEWNCYQEAKMKSFAWFGLFWCGWNRETLSTQRIVWTIASTFLCHVQVSTVDEGFIDLSRSRVQHSVNSRGARIRPVNQTWSCHHDTGFRACVCWRKSIQRIVGLSFVK